MTEQEGAHSFFHPLNDEIRVQDYDDGKDISDLSLIFFLIS